MKASLLFSNVPFDCSDEQLRRWIEDQRYPVSSVTLIRDVVSGTSPSFAYVQLGPSVNLEEAARTLNGRTLGGRTLCVSRFLRQIPTTEVGRAADTNA
jgi:hypothetical protein